MACRFKQHAGHAQPRSGLADGLGHHRRAINGLFLGLGIVVLGVLYVMKSMLGINVLADLHLQDLLF